MINPLPKKKIQQSYFVVIVSIFLYILTLSAPLPIHAAEKKAEPVLVSSYEGGKLYKVGKINLLVLNGSYSDMGKQYGKLMGHQISDMYDEIIRQYKKNGIEAKKQTIQQFSKKQFALFPQKFRLLANEMSVSSGISINKIEVINSFFDYFLLSISNEDGNHCASVTCQGPYTKNGSLITGRNFDF
ncbi:MAG: hypothetical protein LWY06_19340, partial [Firmicutes bacterium]|nr:hypothetical protein [Bacillota bacterium]